MRFLFVDGAPRPRHKFGILEVFLQVGVLGAQDASAGRTGKSDDVRIV